MPADTLAVLHEVILERGCLGGAWNVTLPWEVLYPDPLRLEIVVAEQQVGRRHRDPNAAGIREEEEFGVHRAVLHREVWGVEHEVAWFLGRGDGEREA